MSAPRFKTGANFLPTQVAAARETETGHGEATRSQNPMARLQTSAGNQSMRSLLGGGQPLTETLRKEMEGRFGMDLNQVRIHDNDDASAAASEIIAKVFTSVRVHDDERAHASAAAEGADAYTVGRDVVFARGRYQPETKPGRRLLAHELIHVLQQPAGTVPASIDRGASCALEEDAVRASAAADAGGPIAGPTVASPSPVLSRQETPAEEKGLWETLRDRALDAMVREGDLAIARDMTHLRAITGNNLTREHAAIAEEVIALVDALLHTVVSLLYFVLGTVVGFIEGIVDMIVGALTLLWKVINFVAAIIADILINAARGLGVDVGNRRGDNSAQMLFAARDMIANLPSALWTAFERWQIEYRAVPPERKAFMLGQLFGQVLALIFTSGAGAARAGKVAQAAAEAERVAAPALEFSATGEAAMQQIQMASMLGPKEAALLGGAAPVAASSVEQANAATETAKKPRKAGAGRELDPKEALAAKERLKAVEAKRLEEAQAQAAAKGKELSLKEARGAVGPLPPVPPELEPLLADIRRIENPEERFAALDALAERPGLSQASKEYLQASTNLRRLTQELVQTEEAVFAGEKGLERIETVELPTAIQKLSTAALDVAKRLRKVGPNYAANLRVTFDEILGKARWEALVTARGKPPTLATDHLFALDRIVKSEKMVELLKAFDKAPPSVRRSLTDRIVGLGDIRENLIRMRGDANGASLKSNKSWYEISAADAKKFGYDEPDVIKMRGLETAAKEAIIAEIDAIIEALGGAAASGSP